MNPKGNLLLGPKYCILNYKTKKKVNKKPVITFYFGGSGNLMYFYNIIKDLSFKKKLKIIVIIGPLSKNKKKILKLLKNLKNLDLIENCKNIDNILSQNINFSFKRRYDIHGVIKVSNTINIISNF